MQVVITHVNEKGYGVAIQNKKTFLVLGALPEETVEIRQIKKKGKVILCTLEKIITPSRYRIEPYDNSYTATSPLQIVTYNFEQAWKREWIQSVFQKHLIHLPSFEIREPREWYGTRNKIEFCFYQDTNGIHLAFHARGTTFGKVSITTTAIAPDEVNVAAQKVLSFIRDLPIVARQLKGMLVRWSYTTREIIIAVYAKEKGIQIPDLRRMLDSRIVGILWIYSDPLSPAFKTTNVEHSFGQQELTDRLLQKQFTYPYHSFFQSFPTMFEHILLDIRSWIRNQQGCSGWSVLDICAGVGTIGISIADLVKTVTCIENSFQSQKYTEKNALHNNTLNVRALTLDAEDIDTNMLRISDCIIVDPPRCGIFPQLMKKIHQSKPKRILYVSCNPATQARDISELTDYTVESFFAYNLYPRTMHVETLAILTLQNDD